jgi:hypothetical protein
MQIAMKVPSVAERLAQLGVEAMPLTRAEFGALVASEVKTYEVFTRKAGLKVN